jgi:predicted cupin superfamily sugar epimerase
MTKNAAYWINRLNLIPHPEGGYFQETYRCPETIKHTHLSEHYSSDRACATAIYFLLEGAQVSKFHRLRSDELWCYHAGSPLTLHVITPDGAARQLLLGQELENDQRPQVLIEHGQWFGARIIQDASYTLVSCIVTPGFDFGDFELATCEQLLSVHPQHQALIELLT